MRRILCCRCPGTGLITESRVVLGYFRCELSTLSGIRLSGEPISGRDQIHISTATWTLHGIEHSATVRVILEKTRCTVCVRTICIYGECDCINAHRTCFSLPRSWWCCVMRMIRSLLVHLSSNFIHSRCGGRINNCIPPFQISTVEYERTDDEDPQNKCISEWMIIIRHFEKNHPTRILFGGDWLNPREREREEGLGKKETSAHPQVKNNSNPIELYNALDSDDNVSSGLHVPLIFRFILISSADQIRADQRVSPPDHALNKSYNITHVVLTDVTDLHRCVCFLCVVAKIFE